MNIGRLAHFLLVGQTAERAIQKQPETAPQDSLTLSKTLDLALALPEEVKKSNRASEIYRYLFVFENFLRDLVKDVLSEGNNDWWEQNVPTDVKTEVLSSEQNEDVKSWMSIGVREKIALTTYPQLLRIIDHCWKSHFSEIIKDKSLIQQARLIAHLRNAICHMTDIPDEEVERIKQVLRDWFRAVEP